MQFFNAAVLESFKNPLIIKKLKIPSLLHGQVLVKIIYSGICRSQLMEMNGLRGNDKFLPHMLGHEGVGIVLDTGSGVTKVKKGDKVIIGWVEGNGIRSEFPIFFDEKNIRINAGLCTTFSEVTVVSENRIYLKPEFLPDKIAALFGCAMLTGAGMVLNEFTPQKNQNVMIIGLGGVGFSALLACVSLNPKSIIAADISIEKRKMAKELGINYVFDPSDMNFLEDVKEITEGGVDIGYECAGSTQSIETAIGCLKKPTGKLIFASHPEFGKKIQIDPYDLIQGITLKGTWGGGSKPDRDIPRFASAIMNQGNFLSKLYGPEFKLEQINDALELLSSGKSIKPLLVM